MGKRKSRKTAKPKAPPRTLQKIPTSFDCPFCNHAHTVECKLSMKTQVGNIHCRVCAATWQTTINHLTEPVDVYSEWLDEIEKANRGHEEA